MAAQRVCNLENMPIKISIPNTTVERLKIDYTPDHWPTTNGCSIHALHIKKTWDGFAGRKWYENEVQVFEAFQSILKPFENTWIEYDCIAALSPCHNNEFELTIDGHLICFKELKLKKLKKELGLKTSITTCNAKIEGGGLLTDGRQRGYNVFLDLPKSKTELLQIQRTTERQKLFRPFIYKVIKDLYKNKFFQLFDNKCFRCGHPDELEIDHHIPIALGGHLVPGNLVALCKVCNNFKKDKHPDEFYSNDKLLTLQPLLEAQKQGIFDFKFDYNFWIEDHKGYLISLGIEPSLVKEIFSNENHYFYIPPPQQSEIIMTISLSVDENG